MKCSVPDCDDSRYGTTSTCHEHYLQRPRCHVDGCVRLPSRRSVLCARHRQAQITGPPRPCEFDACERRAVSLGLCAAHAKQRRKGQALQPLRAQHSGRKCSFEGCERPHCADGLCATHYSHKRKGVPLKPLTVDRRTERQPKPACIFDACGRPARGYSGTSAYCAGHYSQITNGRSLGPLYKPKSNLGHVTAGGYRLISVAGEPILEHRAVMQQVIGRPLKPYENVHHRNGDKLDNRPENLELWVNKQPRGQRVEDLIAFIVDHYRPQLMRRLEQELVP